MIGILARVCAAVSLTAAAFVVPTAVADASPCSDVDVSFARGTGEFPGLGITGRPFVDSLVTRLGGRSVGTYAVNYAADVTQASAGPVRGTWSRISPRSRPPVRRLSSSSVGTRRVPPS